MARSEIVDMRQPAYTNLRFRVPTALDAEFYPVTRQSLILAGKVPENGAQGPIERVSLAKDKFTLARSPALGVLPIAATP